MASSNDDSRPFARDRTLGGHVRRLLARGRLLLPALAAALTGCAAGPTATVAEPAVASCCNSNGRAMCVTRRPLSDGAPCVCRAADAQGAFVVQGSACKAS